MKRDLTGPRMLLITKDTISRLTRLAFLLHGLHYFAVVVTLQGHLYKFAKINFLMFTRPLHYNVLEKLAHTLVF